MHDNPIPNPDGTEPVPFRLAFLTAAVAVGIVVGAASGVIGFIICAVCA